MSVFVLGTVAPWPIYWTTLLEQVSVLRKAFFTLKRNAAKCRKTLGCMVRTQPSTPAKELTALVRFLTGCRGFVALPRNPTRCRPVVGPLSAGWASSFDPLCFTFYPTYRYRGLGVKRPRKIAASTQHKVLDRWSAYVTEHIFQVIDDALIPRDVKTAKPDYSFRARTVD